jgi:hypothetical protein
MITGRCDDSRRYSHQRENCSLRHSCEGSILGAPVTAPDQRGATGFAEKDLELLENDL